LTATVELVKTYNSKLGCEFMGDGSVDRSRTAFAKIVLLFFAVLFTAVLIHPDLDLLDVHDVKISSVRPQLHSVEGQLLPRIIAVFGRPRVEPSLSYNYLRSTDLLAPSSALSLSAALRI